MIRTLHATRRQLLAWLAALPAGLALAGTGAAAETGDDFLWASRVIAGTDGLSPDVAARIRALLAARIEGFDGRLAEFAAAILPPDPAWRAFAVADHADFDAAWATRPGGGGATE